jgi:glycosyltransferase involved in cell wall biosynthesis
VDSLSTDKTLEICREFTDKIVQRPWPGYVEQKRFALELCSSEWVLNLDADEEVSPELRDAMIEVLSTDRGEVHGCLVSRVVFYMNRWWRRGGWYPEYRLRMCRRSRTQWGGEDPHEKATVDGRKERLDGELRHYTYSDLTHQVRTLNSFSLQGARSMQRKGKRASKIRMFLNPVSRFIKFYILRRGYREGFPGLVVACMESYYVFLKYAKLWELERNDQLSKE